MKTVQRCRQKVSHSRLEVQPLRRLDRRLFSVWNAGRPLCDSTQIGVACQYCVGEQGSRRILAPLLYHQPTTNSIKRDEAPIQVLRIVTLSQTNSIHLTLSRDSGWKMLTNVNIRCHVTVGSKTSFLPLPKKKTNFFFHAKVQQCKHLQNVLLSFSFCRIQMFMPRPSTSPARLRYLDNFVWKQDN